MAQKNAATISLTSPIFEGTPTGNRTAQWLWNWTADRSWSAYSQTFDWLEYFWFGENPYGGEPELVVTPEQIEDVDTLVCYIGRHIPTITHMRSHQDLHFVGHRLKDFDSRKRLIRLIDSDMASLGLEISRLGGQNRQRFIDSDNSESYPEPYVDHKTRTLCFSMSASSSQQVGDVVRSLGFFENRKQLVWMTQGEETLIHSGTGRVIASSPGDRRQAARLVVEAGPMYAKNVYLVDGTEMIFKMSPGSLAQFAEDGSARNLQTMTAGQILPDYYAFMNGRFSRISPAGIITTAIVTSISTKMLGMSIMGGLAVGSGLGLALPVLAPLVLNEEALDRISPTLLPLATLQAGAGHGLTALGGGMGQLGAFSKVTGNALASYVNDHPEGYPLGSALVLPFMFLLPTAMQWANWLTFGSLAMAYKGACIGTGAAVTIGVAVSLLMYTDMSMDDVVFSSLSKAASAAVKISDRAVEDK